VSVKFGADAYPSSPGSQFRSHLKDLAQLLACFKHSPKRLQSYLDQIGINQIHDVGVLFWFNNEKNSDVDLIQRTLTASTSDLGKHGAIFVVDNKRMAFIFDCLGFAHLLHATSSIEVLYFDTGKNTNPLVKVHSGLILPVEYINTSVLPLRIGDIDNTGTNELMLFCSEAFTREGLCLLFGMAQRFSGSWANRVLICFPDYDPLIHANDVQQTKASFSDKNVTSVLEVACYASDFRNPKP
jgi:hypothetical protein